MEKITLVLKPGLGLNFEAMRPALQAGAAVAIGRGGAVIETLLAGDAPGSMLRLIGRLSEGVDTLEDIADGLENTLLNIERHAEAGQNGSALQAMDALRRIRELTAAFLDNSGARAERGVPASGAAAEPDYPGAAAARRRVDPGEQPHSAQSLPRCGICSEQGHAEENCHWKYARDALAFAQRLDQHLLSRAQAEQQLAELPPLEEHLAQVERVAADLREHGPYRVQLKPCSFCGGPPVPFVQLADRGFGAAPRLDSYGDDGLSVEAFVFCHECGARGPIHEDDIFDASDYDWALEAGVDLWQNRDERHAQLYLAGEAEGLNLFPRPDIAPGPGALCAGVDVATDRVELAIHNWTAPAEGGDA
ncbi:hypothetical protein [Pseudomonas sp. NBRC 100443]|uniref:hypothetical protein n=1 Tax=Pseudomonas sp. NBRC 100443 TaxID=1113665 RepID=UPI0024A2BA3B|nr:hypothetical protein [Pseudomonas sp. NBRC 100443]GLU37135.1 hypothetical protein Pssp01_12280 [Pseudomonas sp. NBRC 100443]